MQGKGEQRPSLSPFPRNVPIVYFHVLVLTLKGLDKFGNFNTGYEVISI